MFLHGALCSKAISHQMFYVEYADIEDCKEKFINFLKLANTIENFV